MDKKYIKALEGITYQEWLNLRTTIDKTFVQQKRELELQLKFSDTNVSFNLIQPRFE